MKKHFPILSVAGLMAALATVLPAPSVQAHGDHCPFCSLDVKASATSAQDAVSLKSAGKTVQFRCVYCALSEAQEEYLGDVTVVAPTEKKNKPLTLKRKGGKWSSNVATAAFVAQKGSHQHCQQTFHAFTNRTAAQAYIRNNKGLMGNASPISLAQMIKVASE